MIDTSGSQIPVLWAVIELEEDNGDDEDDDNDR